MVDSNADKVLPGLAPDVVVVLLERNEEDVHVEGWEVDSIHIEIGYVLRERGALRRREGIGMGINSPKRHGC